MEEDKISASFNTESTLITRMRALSSRTPLKAERFERDDAFFLKKLSFRESHLLALLRFFLKKNEERPNASRQIKRKHKKQI